MTAEVIEGARVVLDDRVEQVSVRLEGGQITGIDVARDGASRVDGKGLLLAPAFVDIHGDAFERQLMPRPGVTVPVEVAMFDTDRQLAASGIATAYHALTLSWEPGLRSIEMASAVLRGLERLAPRLAVDNRIQLRWETFCFEAIDLIDEAFSGAARPALAFNDHTSAAILSPSIALHDRPFDFAPDYPTTDFESPAFREKMDARAKRSGLEVGAYVDLIRRIWDRRPDVRPIVEDVATRARAAGVPMLSHDDSQTETRRFYRGIGATTAEFPMHERVLAEAREAGDLIVFGAPNAMRGGSHLGSPGAARMIERGYCDILASDYFYPAMLGAVARLRADRILSLPKLWALVSSNPARALGLSDRGTIEPGRRADLILVDWPEGGTPSVNALWSAGRPVLGPLVAA